MLARRLLLLGLLAGTLLVPFPWRAPATTALVDVPLANLGVAPGRNGGADLADQEMMGTVITVLRQQGGWDWVGTARGYHGWVPAADLLLVQEQRAADWLHGPTARILVRRVTLAAGATGPATGSTLLLGTTLPVIGERNGLVQLWLPDAGSGWVPAGDVLRLPAGVTAPPGGIPQVLALARSLVGIPYVWGGTSVSGFDCSGFTQFVYGWYGYYIGRDVRNQWQSTVPVSDANRRPGDLVYFTTYQPGPSHVGIWLGGDAEFIAAGYRGVAVYSLDPHSPAYDPNLVGRYLGARRVIQAAGPPQ